MNSLSDQIRHEITERGAIPFARFMDLALYCPLCGYYEKKKDTPGQRGDFYTSVSVGPLFGQLLALQFAEWLEALPIAGCRLPIVETGAHDGRLAKDVLTWLRLRRPGLFEQIEYWIVEPSARRQEWQRESLKEFDSRVRWFGGFHSLAAANRQSVRGVIFSNELLDAMPVHRLGWDAKRHEWFEWGVALDREKFVWVRLSERAVDRSADSHVRESQQNRMNARTWLSALLNLPTELLDVLPDGFTTDICPAAGTWWREAVSVLKQGKLLTLDYGLSAEEFFAPQRANGTLRAYHHHRLSDDVLANPGEQDLTTHVNFTAIQRAGEGAGLITETFASQTQFLTGIAQRAWREGSGFGPWTRERTRQFQTLTHPDHLGRSFRVLVQSR